MDEWLDIDDLIDKAEELIEIGLYDEALKILDQYISIYSDYIDVYILYGRIYLETNEPTKAIVSFRKGLKIDPDSLECLLGMFYAYAMLHRIKKGGDYLFRAGRNYPDDEAVITAKVFYYTELNLLDKAIQCFENAMQKHIEVTGPELFRNVAIAYQRSGFFDKAEHYFKMALEKDNQNDDTLELLSNLYLYKGEESKALELYKEALKRSPNNIHYLSRLIFIYTTFDKMDDAISTAKNIIKIYHNSPVGYIDLAFVYLNMGKPELAKEFAEKALDISPLEAEALRIMAVALCEMEKWKEGKEYFIKAIEIAPDNSDILRDYYHNLRDFEEYDEMEEIVKRVIKLESPYCLEEYWFLADFYRERGDLKESFKFLHKAYKSMPGEKELLPPMIDLLIERGHIMLANPLLWEYVNKVGWNEIMEEFFRHKKFKGKFAQENLRLLRYNGEKLKEFREFIFKFYLRNYLVFFVNLTIIFVVLPLSFFFGLKYGIISLILYLSFYIFYKLWLILLKKRREKSFLN
ncbi:MAG: tetratricopeptide repeat protein [Chitinispirillaceae bacterium]|nr:tetratricopeptide repeat protein [Chitinispirillaceae bacterium]